MRLRVFLQKYAYGLMALLCVLLYVAIATYRLVLPGLHYDEVFYMNAALGPLDGDFVFFKIGNFPVMIMSYIGALKAWIYAPVFAIFGVSPLTIRLPNILLSAFGLFLLYTVAKKMFDKKVALLTVLLTAVDPTFIVHTRLDFGPVVLAFVIRLAVLWSFFRLLERKTTLAFLTLALLLGIGIFNKLDFTWFVCAFLLSAFVGYHSELREIWKLREKYRLIKIETKEND